MAETTTSSTSPAQRVYDAFGGPMEVARATGISYQEVYRWRYTKAKRGCNGHVPHKHQETILRAAAELKLSLKPADLVMIPA